MAHAHIEVDTSLGSSDSDYETGPESDTTSLVSEAKSHVYENGRRYHGYKQSANYLFPNDETEQDRMDLQHHYHLLALDGELYTAPLKGKALQRILDVGTGTGIWCVDIGDEFPCAEVVGIDLSPIQPEWVPPNVKFEIDNLEEDWTWPENHFDYIHLRSMAMFVSDWKRLVQQAYRALAPGGYLELQDLTDYYECDDGSITPSNYVWKWRTLLAETAKKMNRPWLEVGSLFEEALAETGFEEIHKSSIKCPLGTWPKDPKMKHLGMFGKQIKLDGAEGFTLAPFVRVLGWDVKDVAPFLDNVTKEIKSSKLHGWERFYSIYARKPERS